MGDSITNSHEEITQFPRGVTMFGDRDLKNSVSVKERGKGWKGIERSGRVCNVIECFET